MNSKINLTIACLFLFVQVYGQVTFQENIEIANEDYHDLNISEPLLDGTEDFMVAGNLFDNSTHIIALKRIDQNGNVVWNKEYTSSAFPNTRVFDIHNYVDLTFMTGSVDDGVNGVKVFVAKIEALTGDVLDINYYDIIGSSFQSVGYYITYTDSDADGDSVPDPGFVIGGTVGGCDPLETNSSICGVKLGFVMRVDFNLDEIWTFETESIVSGNPVDYDMVNHITETSDGFFITGSAVEQNPNTNNWQQTVLAHKVDFLGVKQWDSSYIFGNSQDVSVDAYYDASTNNIFMLSNYSVSHQFGITALNNTTGVIDFGLSWYLTNNELNHYGFTIMESLEDPNNLIITGYDRDEIWTNGTNTFNSQSNVFVYEFNKASGIQIGHSHQYLVENSVIIPDPYNFWNGQMPFIYYPDISFNYVDNTGMFLNYFHIGYKTNPNINLTNSNIFKTLPDKVNECDKLDLAFNLNSITVFNNPNTDSGGGLTIIKHPFSMSHTNISSTLFDCEPVLAVNDESFETDFIFPNPVSDLLYIEGNDLLYYKISDTSGKSIKAGTVSKENPISVRNLKAGIYFIKILSNDNSQTFKFIKK